MLGARSRMGEPPRFDSVVRSAAKIIDPRGAAARSRTRPTRRPSARSSRASRPVWDEEVPSGSCLDRRLGWGSRHSSGASEPGGPVPRTGFDPRAHGFHFANDFVDKVVTVPGYGEVATDGRSGGMAFAALDYWFAGLPVPSHRPNDFPDRAVPSDGTRLADFSHKRLFDDYATWSARQFLTWTLAEDHPTWSSPGVNSWTPTLGGNFVAQFTARNHGEYRAHLSELRLAVRGPAGENLDRFLDGDGDPTPLDPGEERAVFKASDAFGTVAGSYAVAAGYLSEQGAG